MPESSNSIRRIILIGLILVVAVPLTIFGIWRWKLAGDVNRRLNAVREAGFPITSAELDEFYPAVPESENAATMMAEAFALLQTYADKRSNQVDRIRLERGEKLTADEKQLYSGFVELNEAALEKAREATKLQKSRYPIDFSLGLYAPLPHLTKLKKLAQCAHRKAVLDLESNNFESASVSVADVLGYARTLDNEPIIISQLVRMALIRISVSTLEACLNAGDLSEEQIDDLSAAYTNSEKTNLLVRAFAGERATFIPYFRMSWAETDRLASGGEDSETSNVTPKSRKHSTALFLTGFFERDLRYYLGIMETNIAVLRQAPPKSLASADIIRQVSNYSKKHLYLLSGMFLPALSKVAIRDAESAAAIRLSRTALAIEKFRSEKAILPRSLNELEGRFIPPTDPFDGKPIRYRLLKKGYVVYSVGPDNHDDGGREKPARKKSSDRSLYDITFTVER